MDNSIWIEKNYDALKEKDVDKIIMPGTHNAGAYKIEFGVFLGNIGLNIASVVGTVLPCVGHYIKNWTLTQENSLYKQLTQGIRVLDLRLSYKHDTNEYFVTHSFVLIPLVKAMEQIKKFLDETTKEVVIITIKEDWTHRHDYDGSNAISTIEKVFEKNTITRTFKPLQEMLMNDERIVLLERFNAPWIKTDKASVKYEFLLEEYTRFNSFEYNILSFTVTADVKTVLKRLLFPCKDIKTLSKDIHKKYPEFNTGNPHPVNTSCIMFDFPTDELVNLVIQSNFS